MNNTQVTDFSPQQDAALKAVSSWIKSGAPGQVFRLFGFAGTGKTTLARQIADDADGTVEFAAFTGKAALMLRNKGCTNARTIHSLIYEAREDPVTGITTFVLNRDSVVKDASLVIIDEVSMVNEELGRDLLSFGVPVLVLGDPAQLPPVSGEGYFTNANPDVMLTEVHRQARDNPIIAMSMIVREGGALDFGNYGESIVVRKGSDPEALQRAVLEGQVLVGRNVTRRTYNARIRKLLGFEGDPQVGDRLVCLRNKSTKGLLNGGLWKVAKVENETKPKRKRGKTKPAKKPVFDMEVEPEDAGMVNTVAVSVPLNFFDGTEGELEWRDRKKFDEFDYGYALTAHKAQGSQWPSVVVFDESYCFRDDAQRWLYTALTRAAERVTVVQ